MARPNQRRRAGVTLTPAAALAELDAWKGQMDMPGTGEAGELDYTPAYYFIAPGGHKIAILREQMEGGRSDEWPLPGSYEVDLVDSNGVSILEEPWRATQFDKDQLMRRQDGADSIPAAIIFEELRITVRNQRAMIDAAERREKTAKDDLHIALDNVGKLTREVSGAVLAKDKAIADKEIAEGRQKELEDALAQMEEDQAMLKPHIQMFVDSGFERLATHFGLPIPKTANGEQATRDADEEFVAGEWDYASGPPGVQTREERERCQECLYDLLRNPFKLHDLVEHKFITWPQARALIWLIDKMDLGPEPKWDEWEARAQAAYNGTDEAQAAE